MENDEIRCQSGNLRAFESSEEKQTPSRNRTSYNPDQLETFPRSFLLVHLVSQMPKRARACSLSAGGDRNKQAVDPNVLTDVWSFLADDSVKIQIYHTFKY